MNAHVNVDHIQSVLFPHGPLNRRTVLFQAHATMYAIFGGFFFLINMLSGPGSLWFFWPMIGYAPIIGFHGVVTYFMNLHGQARDVERLPSRHIPARRPAAAPAPVRTRQAPKAPAIDALLHEGIVLVKSMRSTSRKIPGTMPRQQALALCDVLEGVLAAIRDNPGEERVAQDVLNRFLKPASKVLATYEQLANRAVPSAQPLLTRVEQEDLPLMLQSAHEVYDRLHRATMIDLEVAREMMHDDLTMPGRFGGARPPATTG